MILSIFRAPFEGRTLSKSFSDKKEVLQRNKRNSSRPSHKATARQATPLGMTISEIAAEACRMLRCA